MVDKTITFEQYLADLPLARRGEIERVWQVVRASVPAGYVEQVGTKFLTYTADGEMFDALADQKNYISLYLMPIYIFPELKAKLDAASTGKKFKCGKSCITFSRADELPLAAVADILATCPDPQSYRAQVRRLRGDCDSHTTQES